VVVTRARVVEVAGSLSCVVTKKAFHSILVHVFVSLHQNWSKAQTKFQTLESVQEEFAKRDLCLHYRVVGDLSSHERVKALNEMDNDLEEEAKEQGHAGPGAAPAPAAAVPGA